MSNTLEQFVPAIGLGAHLGVKLQQTFTDFDPMESWQSGVDVAFLRYGLEEVESAIEAVRLVYTGIRQVRIMTKDFSKDGQARILTNSASMLVPLTHPDIRLEKRCGREHTEENIRMMTKATSLLLDAEGERAMLHPDVTKYRGFESGCPFSGFIPKIWEIGIEYVETIQKIQQGSREQ